MIDYQQTYQARSQWVRQLRDRLFAPDPATKTVGYWCGLAGVVLVIYLVMFVPNRTSVLWRIAPWIIMGGLGMELLERRANARLHR